MAENPSKKYRMSLSKIELDQKTMELIHFIAEQINESIQRGEDPSMEFPIRSLINVKYDAEKGCFELGDSNKLRTLTVNFTRSLPKMITKMYGSLK